MILLAFVLFFAGVMSFILILIIVMVILVTTVNLRGWCNNTKEGGEMLYVFVCVFTNSFNVLRNNVLLFF